MRSDACLFIRSTAAGGRGDEGILPPLPHPDQMLLSLRGGTVGEEKGLERREPLRRSKGVIRSRLK